MAQNQRGEADLPPGPGRDLVALLRLLRSRTPLTVGQLALRSGLAAGHVSEVLRGWKAPSPNAAEGIAHALGADQATALRARRLAEALAELNRHTRARERAARSADTPARGAGRRWPAESIPESTSFVHPLRDGTVGRDKSIGIVTGDLRRVRNVDVWVNSENTDMKMSRFEEYTISAIIRYDGSVRDAAGHVVEDTIADELAHKVEGLCPVVPGTAVMTGSGQLAQSHDVSAVVHVAAVYGEPGDGYRQIRDPGRCVTGALAEIDRAPGWDRDVSVLFPMLGTGQGRGSIGRTAAVLVGTAAEYLAKTPATRVDTVWFLAHTHEELAALRAAIDDNPLIGTG
jgi:O-acetyl-ADP-ribose deacetylase (regulator of RNase III)